VSVLTQAGDEVSSDQIQGAGRPAEFRLAHGDDRFYVLSPAAIIVATPRDEDDHITWLLERQRFADALAFAEQQQARLVQHRLSDVGERYLAHLLEHQRIEEAAALLPKVAGPSVELWERWVFRFSRARELDAIVESIPTGSVRLHEHIYGVILSYFLASESGYARLLALVRRWPQVYSKKALIASILERPPHRLLDEALARLYRYEGQHEETLRIYLKLKHPKAFALIAKYNLFERIADKVVLLMDHDRELATKLLVANTHRIAIAEVVRELEARPELLQHYLHALFLSDPNAGTQFHEPMIALYAQYQPKALLNFLRASQSYPLEHAYAICEARGLYAEMVFIMSRMGNNQDALRLLIDKVQDIKEAILFVKQYGQGDRELWEDLITHSLKHPDYVAALLENVGVDVDPIQLINRIPTDMQIPGLGERLVKIISDYNLQTSLLEGCNSILKADVVSLEERMLRARRTAVHLPRTVCASCSTPIVDTKTAALVVVFFCSHAYHATCLVSDDVEAEQLTATQQRCPICQAHTSTRALPRRRVH
jgi:hypothetical protein